MQPRNDAKVKDSLDHLRVLKKILLLWHQKEHIPLRLSEGRLEKIRDNLLRIRQKHVQYKCV